MHVFTDEEYGKHSVTHYKVLKRFGYVTLVECKLETGRTHQIRVHFSYKYKQYVNNCFKIIPRQALHAKTLGFIHPETNEEMHFNSELPNDMQAVLEKWEHYIQYRNVK